jgi:cell division septation protein DedD
LQEVDVAQDDYYYEIQLTNKQLVFYFMAGASGLILSFLAGIMVGRGVDATPEVQAASNGRPAFEEEPAAPSAAAGKSAALPSEDLKYDGLLTTDKGETTASAAPDTRKGSVTVPVTTLPPTTARRVDPAAIPAVSKPPVTTTTTASAPPVASAGGSVSLQVGAYQQRASADSHVVTLKKKGYPAYVVSPDGADSLFLVRVGPYSNRASAEGVKKQLASSFSLKPFIVERQ